ncbi:MAG: glycerol-3-phosphate acyltransferase, partial [Rhizobacter sp.]|nr:glycerol-3-phosphate acyltransferase [Chlorobiales bacterium]
MSNFVYIALMSYAIGSIPFAYLAVRLRLGKDIRTLGSGNVGALNSFETSGSKGVGVAVMLLDVLKGAAAVLIARQMFGETPERTTAMTATFFVMLGHCYPVWLRFHGGRGLATGLGATVLFMPAVPILWGVMWVAAWFYSNRVHFCNISATICTLILIPIFERMSAYPFIILVLGLVIIRHLDV